MDRPRDLATTSRRVWESENGSARKRVLTIHVGNQNRDMTPITMKRKTRMKKLFRKYAMQLNVDYHSLCFLLDGKCIGADCAPEMLKMEDGDHIDAMLERRGC